MIDMLKRHAIQVLRAAGHGQSEIATLTDVSVRSVRRVEAEPDVSHVDDAGERDRRRIGRPSIAEPFRPHVVELLTQDPALLSVEIFRRAKLAGYPGGKSALYDLIHAIRPKAPWSASRASRANSRNTILAKSTCGTWTARRSGFTFSHLG
jgi:hypothetical protein